MMMPICPQVLPKPFATRSPTERSDHCRASASSMPFSRATCSIAAEGVRELTISAPRSKARKACIRNRSTPPMTTSIPISRIQIGFTSP